MPNPTLSLLKLYCQLQGLQLEDSQLQHRFVEFDKEGQATPMGLGQVVQALHSLGEAGGFDGFE